MLPILMGTASWYGPECQGNLTSCGEVFDYHELTCAHQYLPMGMVLFVWSEHGCVLTLVNDRIPRHYGREMDLSQAAFGFLDDLDRGVVEVRYVVLFRWLRPSMRYNLGGSYGRGDQNHRAPPD